MEDIEISIPRDFLEDFLEALRPDGPRQVAIVGTVKDAILHALIHGANMEPKRQTVDVTNHDSVDMEFTGFTPKPKRRISEEGRKRIAAAQRKRWATTKRKGK